MRTRVYIAGPMSCGDRLDNFSQALAAFRALAQAGYAPLCPHLTFFAEPFMDLEHATWLDIDLPWVSVAHAVLRLPGYSLGADRETACAAHNSLPIFHNLTTLFRQLPQEQ
jgi:hypothetical protein